MSSAKTTDRGGSEKCEKCEKFSVLTISYCAVCGYCTFMKFEFYWSFQVLIGTVYPNIPLSSASLHGHPRSSLGATLGVRMSATAYGNHSTVSSVWPIGASRLNLRPRPLSI